MSQVDLFSIGEGDAWFERNRTVLLESEKTDWPSEMLAKLPEVTSSSSILEIGCANGYRLAYLQKMLAARCVGVEISAQAIKDGLQRYRNIELHQGSITQVPLSGMFDVLIVNYVLHWVDRNLLLQALSEIDRLLVNGGYLLLGDFYPNVPVKRAYHHLPDKNVFTFKQDYAKAFKSLGTYKEVDRVCYDHDNTIGESVPESRAMCVTLKKSLNDYYQVEQ